MSSKQEWKPMLGCRRFLLWINPPRCLILLEIPHITRGGSFEVSISIGWTTHYLLLLLLLIITITIIIIIIIISTWILTYQPRRTFREPQGDCQNSPIQLSMKQGSGDFWAQPTKIHPFTTSTGFAKIWPVANLLPFIWTGQYPIFFFQVPPNFFFIVMTTSQEPRHW